MNEPIIEVKNIGKKYKITHEKGGYVSLRDVMMYTIKNPFSFLKSKAKKVAGFAPKEDFWALKNVSFSVERGEVIGVIGANGAGKSTLLKILSRITPPTEGEIILRGRVGSLLEVGTGFHPELSGRENIFLNGAILGMRKQEIAEKFNEIVEFAGIEKFLDTPVKHYSSGMYVRLAFSVAAHMEPDILIVDEVLAVGDAEFQKKCIGKMNEITKKQGRTILFVSHNMAAISELCNRCLLIEKGKVTMSGKSSDVISHYMKNRNPDGNLKPMRKIVTDTGEVKIIDSWVQNEKGERAMQVAAGERVSLVIKFNSKLKSEKTLKFAFALISNDTREQISDLWIDENWKNIPENGIVSCTLPKLPLNIGVYSFNVCIRMNGFIATWMKEAALFEVVYGDFFGTKKLPDKGQGNFLIEQDWKIIPN